MIVGLLFGSTFLTACLMPAQSDTYWHLRAGQEIWRTHHVPFVERWSHTAAGSFWPNHEWLWQAASYALYRVGGMPLLTAVAAAIVTAAFALVYRLTVGSANRRFAFMIAGPPIAACVWALRPQIVSLAFVVLLVTLLTRERYRLLVPLFIVWANVHGAVALGLAILGAAALTAAFRARSGDAHDRRRAVALALLTPACAAATALTPLGPRLWTFIGESMERSRQTVIVEWMPAYPTGLVEIGFWVVAIVFVGLLARRWRGLSSWSSVVVVVSALVVLPMAARAVRNIAPFMMLAIPAISRLIGAPASVPAMSRADRPRLNLALLVGLTLAGAVTIVCIWIVRPPLLGWQPLPAGAVGALRACEGPLYNRYNDGGYLIWFVPEKPVFIDSRQDPYPLPFLVEAVRSDNGGNLRALFERYAIRCALLPKGSPGLASLAADAWETRFSDEKWAVLARAAP